MFEIDSVKDAALLVEIDRFAKLYGCQGESARYDEMLVSLRERIVDELEQIWIQEAEL